MHITSHQVFRPSTCKQIAVGVYRTLTVQLTQVGTCVTSWLKCSMHKATTHPTGALYFSNFRILNIMILGHIIRNALVNLHPVVP